MQPEVKWLMEYLDDHDILPEMEEALAVAQQWASRDHGYASKNLRIQEWAPDRFVLYEIVTHIFAGCLLHPQGMTYQAMIGYISGNITCADPLDRAKCAAEIIAIAYQCNLVVITKVSDKTMMVTTEFELPVEIPEFGKHLPLFKKPEPVSYNPILGNRFKQHGEDACTEHIDRMNSIPLDLEYRIITDMEETAKAELITDEQLEQWEDFKRRSDAAYQEAAHHRCFYLEHSYDTRGRSYCSGYYITYQGSQYKKAIIQLAQKELVKI